MNKGGSLGFSYDITLIPRTSSEYAKRLSAQVAFLLKLRLQRELDHAGIERGYGTYGWKAKIKDFNQHFKHNEPKIPATVVNKETGESQKKMVSIRFNHDGARREIPAWGDSPNEPKLSDQQPPDGHVFVLVRDEDHPERDGKFVDLGPRINR